MRRRERASFTADRLTPGDIDTLNRLFSDAFTDRYSRDGMVGVRVPFLNPAVWRYAIEAAGDGAMAWRDDHGHLVAFNLAHLSGTEGWMGPLAVRPDRQNAGLGGAIVRAAIGWLREQGAATIGLETMPRTVENIGFYSRLGFVPTRLTITMVHDADRRPRGATPLAGADAVAECRALAGRLRPGIDFQRELTLTHELGLGGLTVVRRETGLVGFALWHTAPLASGRPRDELRVLKLAAADDAVFIELLAELRVRAAAERVRRVSLRCQTEYTGAYRALVEAGFRVHWTDLRMVLSDSAELPVLTGVVLSNWEI
jgi:GNAT superfamily N-acetyltransferase